MTHPPRRRRIPAAFAPILLSFALAGQASLAAQPGVAVERRLAERAGLRVGDTVELTPSPTAPPERFRVAAIYEPMADPAIVLRGEFRIRMHLPDLATLLGAPDQVDRFAVAVQPGVAPESLARRINRSAIGYRAYPSEVIARESSKTFLVVSRFHRAIGAISIVASAVFLLCVMLLKVEERRLDAAVMRMIGISRATVIRALVLEATLLAAIGSVLGIGLAFVATHLTNWGYQRRFDTTLVFASLSPGLIGFCVGLSLVLGIGAGALAATRLLRVNPLVLWRRAG